MSKFSKTFFALLLLLLSLISLCEQGRSGDFSHSYVESLFLILVAYELFGSYAMYSFYLRLKKEAMHPVRPVVGVEQKLWDEYYTAQSVPNVVVAFKRITPHRSESDAARPETSVPELVLKGQTPKTSVDVNKFR